MGLFPGNREMFHTSTPLNGHHKGLESDGSLNLEPIDNGEIALPRNLAPVHNADQTFGGTYLHHRQADRSDRTPPQSQGQFCSSNAFATAQSKPHKVYFSPTKEVITYNRHNGMSDSVVLTSLDDRPGKEANTNGRFSWTDPRVPYVLSLYLQLFFNVMVVSVVLYLMYVFVSSVRLDVLNKVDVYTSDAMQQISYCSREFYRNKCTNDGTHRRAPALESSCMEWEKCMNRDPLKIGKSKITAETFAEILNSFLHHISWKSLLLVSFFVVASIVTTNVAFVSYRRKAGLDTFAAARRVEELEHKLQATLRNAEHYNQILAPSTPPADFFGKEKETTEDSMLPNSSPLSRKNSGRLGRLGE